MKSIIAIFCLWLGVVTGLRAANPAMPVIPATVFNVLNYGAVGDGVTDNTISIQSTINAANAAGGGEVEIPAGTFLSGPLTLLSEINLHIDTNGMLQMLPLGTYPGGATNAFTFIYCNQVHDLEISGQGRIDGQGAAWWAYNATNSSIERPMMLELFSVNRLFIHDITYQNPPYHHCGLRSNGGNITISNLTVNTPSPSPNTDGLNFVGTNSIIENCHISDGDDNIAMGSTGPLSDLLITNCTFGTGHGVSIGGSVSVGVSNLTVINCTFSGTSYGIRMKSDTNGGALVQDCHYLNLSMTNILSEPITVYSYYNEIGTPTSITPATAAGEIISPLNSATPAWRDILISNLTATVTSSGAAGIIWGRTELPATNIVMTHVNISAPRTFAVYNAQGIQFLDSTINLVNASGARTFTIWNANLIVSNSAPATNFVTVSGLGGNTNDSLAFYDAFAFLTSTDLFGANPLTLGGGALTNLGNLSCSQNEVMNFALGTNNSTVFVTGNLTLSGIINITNAAGFTTTNYTLFNYSGSLAGQVALGAVPGGYTCVLDTRTAGQVKLDVTYTGVFATATTNTIQSSANPSPYGSPVTFTATVTPAPTNGETVNFMDGLTFLGTGTLAGGQAAFTSPGTQLAPGAHAITALYGGDTVFGASTSAVLTQNIGPPVGTVFSDSFGSSTVDSSSPAAPTATSASYQILSGKPWNPVPNINSGKLAFGIGSTSSGVIELQSLFTTSPVALGSAGDFVQLKVTFTDTAGILTQSGIWCFGLYHSGGSAPVAGGLNGNLATSSTTADTGGTQDWQGYVAQIAFTGGLSGFYDRESQATGTANNDQGLLTTGTSSSYQSPIAAAIGSPSTEPSTTLTAGNQYTEILNYTLTASGALQLQSQLYTGPDATGTLMSSMTSTTGTPLVTSFDGLAFGWRATGSTPSTMTVTSISVTSQTTPPALNCNASGGTLALSWPASYLGWLVQSNAVGLNSTNWNIIPGSSNATALMIPINTTGNVFYRLVSP